MTLKKILYFEMEEKKNTDNILGIELEVDQKKDLGA